jgi:hypothetical protein
VTRGDADSLKQSGLLRSAFAFIPHKIKLTILLIYQARQKNSWVDSGSGSLPSE